MLFLLGSMGVALAADLGVVVVDSEMGLPIPRVEVEILQGKKTLKTLTTDAEGKDNTELAPGRYLLSAKKAHFQTLQFELIVTGDAEVTFEMSWGSRTKPIRRRRMKRTMGWCCGPQSPS